LVRDIHPLSGDGLDVIIKEKEKRIKELEAEVIIFEH
jgi:hypothetical protein